MNVAVQLPMTSRTSDILAAARTAAAVIATHGDQIERDKALPPAVLDALHAHGLIRGLLPRSLNGHEMRPADYIQMIEILAAADGSTAWCVNQASGCSMAAAYMTPEAARHIWGDDPRASVAWGMGPGAIAQVVDGGYRVTGKWAFASGGRHASWIGGHCNVRERDGTLRLDQAGAPLEVSMMMPRADVPLTDTWHVMGLRGTGSDTYGVSDYFVPEDHAVRRDVDELRREAGTLYWFTTTHMYASGFAAVGMGIARGMLDAFRAVASEKTPSATTRAMRDSAVVQREIALAEARLRAARALLLETLRTVWDHVAEGGPMSLDDRMSIRLASTYAIHQAKEVVQICWQEAGTTAIFNANPFERRFRDMHSVTQQVQARTTHFETVGQHLMGMAPPLRFI